MSGNAIAAAIRPTPRGVTTLGSGRVMMRAMASARSTATPAKERGQRFRTSLRAFRGIHKPSWLPYVATYEAMVKATWVTSHLIRRM